MSPAAPSPGLPRAAHAPFARADAERFLRAGLERAAAERAVAVVRFPAPRAPVDLPLRAVRKGPSVTWVPPDGAAVGAAGVTARLALRGSDRFAALRREGSRLFGAMLRQTHPDAPPSAPRLFGGWAFAEGSADEAPWDGFGDGAFVLPRWSYERTGDTATLTAAVDLRDGWTGRLPLVRAELAAIWAALTRPPPPSGAPRITSVAHLERARWDALVEGITEAVRRGGARKIVAARRAVVRAERELDPGAVVRALARRYPETWRFALRLGVGTFVGATPERLFVKRGRRIETDALAGSIAAEATGAEAALRASAKNRREHTPVVDHLLEELRPFCVGLEPAAEPEVRVLPNVLHLHTPIRGTLRPDVHAADLVEALHPTPAVGGVPGAVASRWITAREAHPRGWYAGPVGWIDADGDAELTVALRCGLVRGASAWLWAGGGIVEGSEAEAEWQESALKLRPLLEALGAEAR